MPEFETSDGVRLHYDDEGGGEHLVVLVAGFTAPATSWLFQQRALVEAGYRVVSFDRRNHGRSEAVGHGQRMARHGMDLAELLELLDAYDATLVGGSMGASTIWACVDLVGTGRIGRIVSVDQSPKMMNADDWDAGYYGLTADNLGTFFAAGIPETGRGRSSEDIGEAVMRLIEQLGAVPDFIDPADPLVQPLLRDHAGQDWRDVIARIDRPVLMVAAEQSQMWPVEHAMAAAPDNPQVRVVVVPDAGHGVNIDQPEAFNRELLAFMADTPGPSDASTGGLS